MPAMLPLIKAVVRVSNAEKQARLDPYYALSEMEMAEIKTVCKIIATTNVIVARAKKLNFANMPEISITVLRL